MSNEKEFGDEEVFPLDVYFCEQCSLVQLMDVVDPEILFRDYIYVTGTSDTIVSHNERYAADLISRLNLTRGQKVAEVASNNGQLLSCFAKRGIDVLGIEPAKNLVEMANHNNIRTINDFFSSGLAKRIRKEEGGFSAIVANNVLAHVDDTKGFLVGCKEMIDDDGLVVFEVPYLKDFLERLEYDTVYHEHLCYFSVTSLARLCEETGLLIVSVDQVPVHGGSLRIYAAKIEHADAQSTEVSRLMEQEKSEGLLALPTYVDFAEDVRGNKVESLALLNKIKMEGGSIAAYGAAAKGNTFLNYCQIGTDLIDYVADRNPLKVGTFTPGAHLPVVDVSEIARRKPDYLLILAWNFADEIMKQQAEFKTNGGKFIIALPEPRVV